MITVLRTCCFSIHCRIFIIFALDLLVVLKAKEVFKFRELILMSRHKIIDVVDSVPTGLVVFHKSLVGQLRCSIARQQKNFVLTCEALKVSSVKLEDAEDFACKFGIKSEATQLSFWSISLREVFVVKVIKPSVILLRHVPHPVECLNVPIAQKQVKNCIKK